MISLLSREKVGSAATPHFFEPVLYELHLYTERSLYNPALLAIMVRLVIKLFYKENRV